MTSSSVCGFRLDIDEKFHLLLSRYSRDLENVRKIYQKMKHDPPIARNLPPVSGWLRDNARVSLFKVGIFGCRKDFLGSSTISEDFCSDEDLPTAGKITSNN